MKMELSIRLIMVSACVAGPLKSVVSLLEMLHPATSVPFALTWQPQDIACDEKASDEDGPDWPERAVGTCGEPDAGQKEHQQEVA